jgi:hypothetical protein
VGRAADLSGAAHLVLAQGVVHLDPATAVFEGMLEGWARQQRTRFLKWDSTIKPRLSLVRRLAPNTVAPHRITNTKKKDGNGEYRIALWHM